MSLTESPVAAYLLAGADARGARFIAREIAQQPTLWMQIAQQVLADDALARFLEPRLRQSALRIVFTGAGSSGYIGRCLVPALRSAGRRHVEAVATTDIVASPGTWLAPEIPTMLVSFARSGNSPESVAAVQLAQQMITPCSHLVVTCNRDGKLLELAREMRDAYTLLLPDATNDQSFAMTSSFTGMLLAAACALGGPPPEAARLVQAATLAQDLLADRGLEQLAGAGYERVVYLGSNELQGLAHESALKMLELTDGQVVSVADSPLAFRHGPKAILNDRTLVVAYLSSAPHTRRYEEDLLQELRQDRVAGRVIALAGVSEHARSADTLVLAKTGAAVPLTDLELCLPFAVFAQTLAVLRSLSLGLSPDRPNTAGTVNRVVQGVTIHPYQPL